MKEIEERELIHKLREHTKAGVMDCKKALVEVKWDFDKAIEYLISKDAHGGRLIYWEARD